MPARLAYKRIHYLRAVYNEGAHPQNTFAQLIVQALGALPGMRDTQIVNPQLGVVAIPHRNVAANSVRLALGAGAPEEAMATMGIGIARPADVDAPLSPPVNRAFKTADGFCYIEEEEILVCVDGGMRIAAVTTYLRGLLGLANLGAEAQAFELRPVSDIDQQLVLEREGVKELTLSGTMSAAAAALEDIPGDALEVGNIWHQLKTGIADVFSREAANEQERETLAENWGNLQITTTIHATGGSRAEPTVLEAMEQVGKDLLNEATDDMEVVLVTKNGSRVKTSELVLGKFVTLHRQEGKNDLPYLDVWAALRDYRDELVNEEYWQA